jgi:hypothetical protein
VSKRTAVVLRSGYRVESHRDPHAVLDHLTSAILGESVVRAREEGVKSWDDVVREIDAEIGHVSKTIDERWSRRLLGIYLKISALAKLELASDQIKLAGLPPYTKAIQ